MKEHITLKADIRKVRTPRSGYGLRGIMRQWDLQSMVLPGFICLILFSYIPMYGVIIAFKEFDIFQGIGASPWVGFYHFNLFFESPELNMVMRNTIIISTLKLVLIFPAPIILALLLNEIRHNGFKRFIQTATYLPHFISWVIVSGLVFSLLSVESGSLNYLLEKLGIIDKPINWLSMPKYFYSILLSASMWKEIGFSSIVYLAAIAGINPGLYEAAEIDGAGRFRKMFSVTLPCIAPVVIIFLILSIGNLLSAGFEDILTLTNNGKNGTLTNVAEVLDTYVYRVGLSEQRYSFATAVGLFKSIINVVLLVAANTIAKRVGGNSLW
ncbi:ABC transporter permease subunit [Paenibacillus sp. sptzw28]|nr:ABC transporter permease subunit [Paenibacillus sp. sptzw28]